MQVRSAKRGSTPSSSALAGPTYVLVLIATLMLQLAIFDRQGLVAQECVQLLLVVGVGLLIRFSSAIRSPKARNALATIGFIVIAGLPFIADYLQRKYTWHGNPLEVQLTLCLRNLMLVLGVGKRDLRGLLFATLASGFLALFSLLWLMNRWTTGLMFLYAVIGMWWLMGLYWDRLSGCFLSRSERRIPWKPVFGASILGFVLLLASLPLAVAKNYTTAISGWLPSSGGVGGQDEFAFGGVGDGPQMVSAKENASGFGPIESELFLESKMPSLYDVINEFSEPPPKPKTRKRQRAIPLAPGQMQQNHKRRGVNERAGREFSTVRRQKQETPKVEDLRSHALLQVVGRVPVHLGLYIYDTWDGRELSSSDGCKEAKLKLELDVVENRNWAQFIDRRPNENFAHQDRHELRIINLKTDRVPAPPNLSAVNIDRIHTEKLFRSTPDGMLAMDMDHIPQLSILHARSLQRRASQLPLLVRGESLSSSANNAVPALAREWVQGVNDGWPQIEAICARLRQDYTLDRKAMVPEETEDAAKHFLVEAKRGPDYLFATSAALLLRSLGYETRVVGGFYAHPKNYDRQSRITSVYADDAHFWLEVLASQTATSSSGAANGAADFWVAIDPTPGYNVLLAPESFWSQLFSRAALTWHALKRNPMRALAIVALFAVVWKSRDQLLDLLVTVWWLAAHRWGDVRHRVTSTICLLERRGRVHGYPRAKGVSLAQWSRTLWSKSLALRHPATSSWQEPFLDLANWALYGEGIPSKYSEQEVQRLCKEAAQLRLSRPKPHRHELASSNRGSV